MSHFYKVPGKNNIEYPSVTTIIHEMMDESEGLKRWKQKPGNMETLEYKAKIGTLVHYRILSKVASKKIELPEFPLSEFPPDYKDKIDIAEYMWDNLNLQISKTKPVWVEHTLFNHEYGYAGKMDLAAYIGDRLGVFDLKTSRGPTIYDSYKLQLGAYWLAFKEMHNTTPDMCAVIKIHPFPESNPSLTPYFKPVPIEDIMQKADEFCEMAKKYHKIHKTKLV